MTQLIAKYSSINDYISDAKNNPLVLIPECCTECGRKTFSLNGFYERKSEDRGKEIQVENGTLFIRRFKCTNKDCGKSYSILPSLIPPLRWYLWCMQQYVIALFFSSTSINQITKHTRISRSTVTRWLSWCKNKWSIFCHELMAEHPWLCGLSQVYEFYPSLFERWKLSQVMCKLHHMGLAIP